MVLVGAVVAVVLGAGGLDVVVTGAAALGSVVLVADLEPPQAVTSTAATTTMDAWRIAARTAGFPSLGLFSGRDPPAGEQAMEAVDATDRLLEHEGAGAVDHGHPMVPAFLCGFGGHRALPDTSV